MMSLSVKAPSSKNVAMNNQLSPNYVVVKYQHCISISKEVIAFLKCYRFFGHPVDGSSLDHIVYGKVLEIYI